MNKWRIHYPEWWLWTKGSFAHCPPRLLPPAPTAPWLWAISLAQKSTLVKPWHLFPRTIRIRRMQATALLGMAEYADGNLHAAEQQFLKFQAMMWKADDIANAISITYILADIMLIQGRLQEAASAYRQSLKLAADQGAFSFLGASDLYRGLSEVLCEQGDLEGAAHQLQTAQRLGERSVLTGKPHRLCIAQARVKEAQGDVAAGRSNCWMRRSASTSVIPYQTVLSQR